jgi:uncharacterized protein
MRNGALIETDDGKKAPAPDSVAAWAQSRRASTSLLLRGLHSKLNRVFHLPYVVESALPLTALEKSSSCWRPGSMW